MKGAEGGEAGRGRGGEGGRQGGGEGVRDAEGGGGGRWGAGLDRENPSGDHAGPQEEGTDGLGQCVADRMAERKSLAKAFLSPASISQHHPRKVDVRTGDGAVVAREEGRGGGGGGRLWGRNSYIFGCFRRLASHLSRIRGAHGIQAGFLTFALHCFVPDGTDRAHASVSHRLRELEAKIAESTD